MDIEIDKETMEMSHEKLKKAIEMERVPSLGVDTANLQRSQSPRGKMREGLQEEYPNVSDNVVSSIFHTIVSEIDDFKENKKECYDVCKVCLDNGITIDELDLLKTVFENDLESATWKGISVIKMSESLEVRGRQSEKVLGHHEMTKLKEVFVERLPYFGRSIISTDGEGMMWSDGSSDIRTPSITETSLTIEANDDD